MLQIALEIVFYVAIINSHIHPIHEATYYASCYCRAGRLSRYWRCHWNRHGSKAQYDQDAITCQALSCNNNSAISDAEVAHITAVRYGYLWRLFPVLYADAKRIWIRLSRDQIAYTPSCMPLTLRRALAYTARVLRSALACISLGRSSILPYALAYIVGCALLPHPYAHDDISWSACSPLLYALDDTLYVVLLSLPYAYRYIAYYIAFFCMSYTRDASHLHVYYDAVWKRLLRGEVYHIWGIASVGYQGIYCPYGRTSNSIVTLSEAATSREHRIITSTVYHKAALQASWRYM